MCFFSSLDYNIVEDYLWRYLLDSCSDAPKLIRANPSPYHVKFDYFIKSFPETLNYVLVSFHYKEFRQQLNILSHILFRHFYILSILYHFDFNPFFSVVHITKVNLKVLNVISISI